MSRKSLFKILAFCLILPSCKYQIAVSPPWKQENTGKALEVRFFKDDFLSQMEGAKVVGKPIFLDFYTDWCGPCRVMDREVFKDGSLATFFNANFINLKVNAEKGEGVALAREFGVSAYPTLLFLDAQGLEKKRVVGITMAPKLLKIGKGVTLITQKSQSFRRAKKR